MGVKQPAQYQNLNNFGQRETSKSYNYPNEESYSEGPKESVHEDDNSLPSDDEFKFKMQTTKSNLDNARMQSLWGQK
jgi:hypothetical protein